MRNWVLSLLRTLVVVLLLIVNFTNNVTGQTRLFGAQDNDLILSKEGSPYWLMDSFSIDEDVSLIIESGVTIVGKSDFGINIEGEVIATGTLAEPIVFQLEKGSFNLKGKFGSSHFQYCNFSSSGLIELGVFVTGKQKISFERTDFDIAIFANEADNLEFEDVVFANLNTALFVDQSNLSIVNSLFKNCNIGLRINSGTVIVNGNVFDGCRIGFDYLGGNPNIEHNKFQDCIIGLHFQNRGGEKIELDNNEFQNCKSSYCISSNQPQELLRKFNGNISLFDNEYEDTITLEPFSDLYTYIIKDVFTVKESQTLVIKPGTRIEFLSNGYFKIAGKVRVEGSDSLPIELFAGSKSLFSGGLYFTSTSHDSFLRNVKLANCNGYGKSSITIEGKRILFKNLDVSGAKNGIWIKGGSELEFLENYIYNNEIGIHISSGDFKILGNNIYNNQKYGLKNSSNSLMALRNNYWGDKSGPKHLGLNMEGKGNEILGKVLINPWLRDFTDNLQVNASIGNLEIHQVKENSKISVILKNESKDILRSALVRVFINEEIFEEFEWTGHLELNENEVVDLGEYTFLDDVEYRILTKVTEPNGLMDADLDDNEWELILNEAKDYIYTIGESNGEFKNISDALNALSKGELGRNVVFEIENGVYEEEIKIKDSIGLGGTHQVLFKSKIEKGNNVVIKGDKSSLEILGIDNVSNLKFKGLSFIGIEISGVDIVNIGPGSKNIEFSNCTFEGKNDTGVVVQVLGNNVTIMDCNILRGNTGVFAYSVLDASLRGIEIISNKIAKQNEVGIALRNVYSPLIELNFVKGRDPEFTGIDIRECIGLFAHKNNIYLGEDGTGLSIYEGKNDHKSKAKINFNELIVNGKGYAFATGLEIGRYNGEVEVRHNAVKVMGENTSSTAIFIEKGQKLNLQNNILSNFGKGYALYIGADNSNLLKEKNYTFSIRSNFNNFYSKGDRLIGAGPDFKGLHEWQVQTGLDKKSYALNPKFEGDLILNSKQEVLNNLYLVREWNESLDSVEVLKSFIGVNYAKPKDNLEFDLALTKIISPNNGCFTDSLTKVKIEMKNLGNVVASGFVVKIKNNGKAVVNEYVGDCLVKPGERIVLETKSGIDLTQVGIHNLEVEIVDSKDKNEENNYKTKELEVMSPLTINISGDTSVCKGTSLKLKASGAEYYNWSTGAETNYDRVRIVSDTSFNVIGYDKFNCIGENRVLVFLSDAIEFPRTINICKGDSIYLSGSFQSKEGIYRDTFAYSRGCDSVVVTKLVVNENAQTEKHLDFSLCENSDPVNITELTGTDVTYKGKAVVKNWFYPSKSGAGDFKIVRSELGKGCNGYESINFMVSKTKEVAYDAYIYEGDSILIGDKFRFEEGVYKEVLQGINGCDSIIKTTLEIIKNENGLEKNSKPTSEVDEDL